MAAQELPSIRIVLLGKTGSGKSSLGNSLLDKSKQFKVGSGMCSETSQCAWDYTQRGQDILEIIDTPGLCDTHVPQDEIFKEVGKSVAVASPGPHIIVLALRCDRRFTDEEFSAYTKLIELFSDEIKPFLVVVFNGMDALGSNIEQQRANLMKEIGRNPGNLATVLKYAGNRFIGMNNNAPLPVKAQLVGSVVQLFKDTLRANNNAFFSTRVIGGIVKWVEGLIEAKALRESVSRFQAELALKRAIVEERERSFAETLKKHVAAFGRSILLKEMCLTQ